MEEDQLSGMDGQDLDELLMSPPVLVRRNAFIEEEDELLPVLTIQAQTTYHEEECPICFCSLDSTNTFKLLCGHVLCSNDLNTLVNMSHSSTIKCHICRALQTVAHTYYHAPITCNSYLQ